MCIGTAEFALVERHRAVRSGLVIKAREAGTALQEDISSPASLPLPQAAPTGCERGGPLQTSGQHAPYLPVVSERRAADVSAQAGGPCA